MVRPDSEGAIITDTLRRPHQPFLDASVRRGELERAREKLKPSGRHTLHHFLKMLRPVGMFLAS
jgi:hypothetical protein